MCGQEFFDEFTDERDGNTYKTVKIGNQVWMAENLRYIVKGTPCIDIARQLEEHFDEIATYLKPKEIKWIREHWTQIQKYGCQYQWATVMGLPDNYNSDFVSKDIREKASLGMWNGIAPKGWRIPSNRDFASLLNYCNEHSNNVSSAFLKAKDAWKPFKHIPQEATDEFGFGMLPTSSYVPEEVHVLALINLCKSFGMGSSFWTATEFCDLEDKNVLQSAHAITWQITHSKSHAFYYETSHIEEYFRNEWIAKDSFFPVRCIKCDEESRAINNNPKMSEPKFILPLPDLKNITPNKEDKDWVPEFGTLTDEEDENIYKTVKIGNQTWMAEDFRYEITKEDEENNLRGYSIKQAWPFADESSKEWNNKQPQCKQKCRWYYSYETAEVLAPEGWRLPTEEDFLTLERFCREHSSNRAETTLKSIEGWMQQDFSSRRKAKVGFSEIYEDVINPIPKGTDRFGMSIYPTGVFSLYPRAEFYGLGKHAGFWCEGGRKWSLSYMSQYSSISKAANGDALAVRYIKDEE